MSLIEDMLRLPVGTWCYYAYNGAVNPKSPALVVEYLSHGIVVLWFPSHPTTVFQRHPANYRPCPPPEGVTVALPYGLQTGGTAK